MGDSLTDKRHWANREVCWIDLLRDRLKETYHSDITILNSAIGGTQLRQNVILILRAAGEYALAGSGHDLLWRKRLGKRDARRGIRAIVCGRGGPGPPRHERKSGYPALDDQPGRRALGDHGRAAPGPSGMPPGTAMPAWPISSDPSTKPGERIPPASSSTTESTSAGLDMMSSPSRSKRRSPPAGGETGPRHQAPRGGKPAATDTSARGAVVEWVVREFRR